MIMRLVWTRLLQYFARTDVARGCVDPSLPWLFRGKSCHDGGSGSRTRSTVTPGTANPGPGVPT